MFTLTFRSASPPPTESTRTASFELARLVRSQAAKTVSHPSSLVRAVSSETLSVGAYASMPHSLRKSLTAWPQFAALPPTPSTNSRPARARRSTRASASRSTTAASTARQMSPA